MGAIAQISGVALVPGVSRNKRLYTPEVISRAAERMQKRLADPNGLPIVMRTHHEAGDDSAKIVGRVTSVTVGEDKALRYKADLYDTFHAKEIANLVTPSKPALRSVSIHGFWVGEPKQVTYEGESATTADDLEIDAIDFTASPGVDAALIDPSGSTAETDGEKRTAISEASEASISLTEQGSGWADITREAEEPHVEPYWIGEAKYSADDMRDLLAKGHAMKNASGEPSYPIADVSDLKKAIRAVGRGKGSHDAIRRHIIKRAKALGAGDLIPDNWGSSGSNAESYKLGLVTEFFQEDGSPSGFCIDAYSGPLSVTVRGQVGPDQLRLAAKAAVCAAMDAINLLDPDDDADIDVDHLGDDDLDMPTSEDSGYMANADYGPDDKKGPKDEAAPVLGINRGGAKKSPDRGAEDGTDEADAVLGINRGKAVKKAIRKAVQKEMAKMMRDTADTKAKGKPNDGSDDDDESFARGKAAPSVTKETTPNKKESAMGDIQAAEAAPNRTLTDEDIQALTVAFAAALNATSESKSGKHAATAAQETTETPEQEVAAETKKAEPTLAELKESLAKELRNELRAEFIKENGLPPRRGYRINENSEEQVEMTDAELYDKHRVDILLGAYARTPSPDDVPAN